MDELIHDIILEEWAQFQAVNNQGGRASCQDDWQQFTIMRASQFYTWPQELLESYLEDLRKARLEGKNLVFHKYAYMMESTDPQGYARLQSFLPVISPERRALLEPTVQIHVKWAEEFAARYPHYAAKGRILRSKDERCGMTSIETYQRGELYSYGEKTQLLYCAFVAQCEREGKNLTTLVREHMAKLYDYKSLEDLERRQSC